MELEIRVRGTESQIKRFLAENRFLEDLVKAGKIATDTNGDNPKMLEAINSLSWETIQLAHIIFVHGTENPKGRYMSKEDLIAYEINSEGDKLTEKMLSARVGGAKRVTSRYGLPEILKIRNVISSGEKRYYVTLEAILALEQYIELHDEPYREYLKDGLGYFYPGEEDE